MDPSIAAQSMITEIEDSGATTAASKPIERDHGRKEKTEEWEWSRQCPIKRNRTREIFVLVDGLSFTTTMYNRQVLS